MFDEREPQPLRPSFATVLDDLWRQRHTGPVTIHFQSGQARTVEIPEEPMRISLDVTEKEAQISTQR